MKLILIRGLPGSGKSTIAKLLTGFIHLEADMYFIDHAGDYKYDPAKIKFAHEWCYREAKAGLLLGRDVVVSNTFTRKCEIDPYLDLAEKFGIMPNIIIATGEFKNVHGVPDAVVEKMRQRWESF